MSTVQVLQRALTAFETPAAGPCPKDIFEEPHWEMAGAHACVANGLLSVYEVRHPLFSR